MIDLAPYKYFYFLGIGGIGMSALARYFNSKGFEVAGYDRTQTELTDELEKEDMIIHFEDDIQKIPAHFLENKSRLLVIYTPAIPKDHVEYNYIINQGYMLKKRAEILASVTIGKQTIAVAGTHGKTSTATMISHIFKTANIPFYAFLGGVSVNYQTNFIRPDADEESDLVVVEADEFDRSFLQLEPDISIITAVESDHLDIYGNEENLKQAFSDFAHKLKPSGLLITHKGISISHIDKFRRLSYTAYEKADIMARDIEIRDGKYHFDAILQQDSLYDLVISVPGVHNIENSLAAMAATHHLIDNNQVFYKALDSFRGVRRRFEMVFQSNDLVYIDDYAHHPTEIRVTLETIRALYPGKKLTGIFQPHLFTRTRDLAADFGKSLSIVDELILLPIYPARELPILGVTSQIILDEVVCATKQIIEKEKVVDYLGHSHHEVIVTLGAGDIDRLVQPIKVFLEHKYKKNRS